MNVERFFRLCARKKNDWDLLLEDDMHFCENMICKSFLISQCEKAIISVDDSSIIRTIPVLASTIAITNSEKQYMESLLKSEKKAFQKESCDSRFYSFLRDNRRNQDIALMKVNSVMLENGDVFKDLRDRLYSDKKYWKRFYSFDYRYTVNDFWESCLGTCLDTAIIASAVLNQMGIQNYILNIRGRYGGHSIVVILGEGKCISNFEFRDSEYLTECLANYDIDSIIVGEKEYWCEDITNESAILNALLDLTRHGGYRFYSGKLKASISSVLIMKYWDVVS